MVDVLAGVMRNMATKADLQAQDERIGHRLSTLETRIDQQFAELRSELAQLRAENKRLRMERDILKKATAFFANEKN